MLYNVVSVYCRAERISHTYMYPLFVDFLPIQVPPGCWVPVPHSGSSFVVSFIRSCVCLPLVSTPVQSPRITLSLPVSQVPSLTPHSVRIWVHLIILTSLWGRHYFANMKTVAQKGCSLGHCHTAVSVGARSRPGQSAPNAATGTVSRASRLEGRGHLDLQSAEKSPSKRFYFSSC